jgi:DNA-binding Lrp family transcriptional regulator
VNSAQIDLYVHQLIRLVTVMDKLDSQLLALLRRDGRASISTLAAQLAVTRATVRARMDRLQEDGEIAGYTVLTRTDVMSHPVRGLMMLEIAGRGTEKITKVLRMMPAIQAVHSTNGKWDLIAEIGVQTLDEFDQALTRIRQHDGITRSETSLLLATRR